MVVAVDRVHRIESSIGNAARHPHRGV